MVLVLLNKKLHTLVCVVLYVVVSFVDTNVESIIFI